MLEATKKLEVGIMQVIETRLLYYFLTVAEGVTLQMLQDASYHTANIKPSDGTSGKERRSGQNCLSGTAVRFL